MGIPDLGNEIEPGSPPSPADGGVEPAAVSQDQAPPSLRETLDAAVREARDVPATDATGDRPRDASGRFLPKADGGELGPSNAQASTKPSATPSASQSPAPAPGTPAAPSTAPAGPPPGWDAAAKAEYAKLPPAVQAAVSRREAEVSAGFAQYAQAKQQLEAVIAPRRQYYAGDGVSDVQAIDNIWKWFEALRNSPQEAMPALAQMFGFDLSTVTPGANANPDQPSPYVRSLEAKVRQLEGRVGEVVGTFEQQQTAARRAELASFAKDKPHFEKVRVTMGRLMQAGVAQGLDDAYQQAVKLDPEAQAAEAATAQRTAAEAALAQRGGGNQRRAAVSVRGGSPNGAAGSPAPTSIRDSLVKGFAEARGS